MRLVDLGVADHPLTPDPPGQNPSLCPCGVKAKFASGKHIGIVQYPDWYLKTNMQTDSPLSPADPR